ncbi:MAG TPA: glycosyltransferase family 4 protein [Steroidobacteraceae bacterium]|nr:glycosyltransferase family 4 protein [Steroidobacteraceae bacterium]
MTGADIAIGALACAGSAGLTALVRRFALKHGFLDVPNDRSSHARVTPRGGGLAIVVVSAAAGVGLLLTHSVSGRLVVALLGGGAAVAGVGFVDDRRPVRPVMRLGIHLLAAVWAVAWLGGLADVQIGAQVIHLGAVGDVLAVLGIVWTLNLFNFMDGIDGIAASEAIFIAAAAAMLTPAALVPAASAGVGVFAGVFACACAGFLVWNWPPARIFMGDVGSGYLGYVIAVLGLQATHANPAAVWVWLILGSLFFLDATLTLIRRSLRRERVHVAHRSHGYQWLARRWRSHLSVTLLTSGLNVLWLLPCAVLASSFPTRAPWILVLAQAPLIAGLLVAGAGRRENSDSAAGGTRS